MKANSNMYIRVDITDKIMKRAKELSGSDEAYNSNSYRNGGGNLVGGIGNAIVEDFLITSTKNKKTKNGDPYTIKYVNHSDYDILVNDLLKVEVKTKHQNSDKDISPEWECCIYKTSFHQKPDIYVFCRVIHVDKTIPVYGVILGKIKRKEFFDKSIFLRKGDVDPDDETFIIPHTCRNMKIKHLTPFKGV